MPGKIRTQLKRQTDARWQVVMCEWNMCIIIILCPVPERPRRFKKQTSDKRHEVWFGFINMASKTYWQYVYSTTYSVSYYCLNRNKHYREGTSRPFSHPHQCNYLPLDFICISKACSALFLMDRLKSDSTEMVRRTTTPRFFPHERHAIVLLPLLFYCHFSFLCPFSVCFTFIWL